MNSKVDFYFNKSKKWQNEIEKLRAIVLDCRLDEVLKWGAPCYTSGNRNIVLIHVFKEYCALLFFKGALLKDEHELLVQQTKNTQATRQLRFKNIREIIEQEEIIKTYVKEAIEIEKSGQKVILKKTGEFNMPSEFQDYLNKHAKLKKAFNSLTPGRQRAYLLFFSAAKQSKTRVLRIEKSIDNILRGKGLND